MGPSPSLRNVDQHHAYRYEKCQFLPLGLPNFDWNCIISTFFFLSFQILDIHDDGMTMHTAKMLKNLTQICPNLKKFLTKSPFLKTNFFVKPTQICPNLLKFAQIWLKFTPNLILLWTDYLSPIGFYYQSST